MGGIASGNLVVLVVVGGGGGGETDGRIKTYSRQDRVGITTRVIRARAHGVYDHYWQELQLKGVRTRGFLKCNIDIVR